MKKKPRGPQDGQPGYLLYSRKDPWLSVPTSQWVWLYPAGEFIGANIRNVKSKDNFHHYKNLLFKLYNGIIQILLKMVMGNFGVERSVYGEPNEGLRQNSCGRTSLSGPGT